MSTSPVGLTVGDLYLTAEPTPGADWGLESIDGWYNSSEVQAPTQERVVQPGRFAQAGRATGKSVIVNGFVKSSDRALLVEAADVISATLADGSFARMTVYDEDSGFRWAPVQRVGQPAIDMTQVGFIKFQLQFLAPDAYRYGQSSSGTVGFAASSGSGLVFDLFPGGVMDFGPLPDFGVVEVENVGTAPSSPVFTVTGPAPDGGFVITDVSTGKRITFLGSVPAGSVLTLDASTGSVVLDDVADRLGDALVDAWPKVPARSVSAFLFEPLSGTTAAEMTVDVVSAYW